MLVCFHGPAVKTQLKSRCYIPIHGNSVSLVNRHENSFLGISDAAHNLTIMQGGAKIKKQNKQTQRRQSEQGAVGLNEDIWKVKRERRKGLGKFMEYVQGYMTFILRLSSKTNLLL